MLHNLWKEDFNCMDVHEITTLQHTWKLPYAKRKVLVELFLTWFFF